MKGIVFAVSLSLGAVVAVAPTGAAGATGSNPTSAGYVAQFAAQAVTFGGSVTVPLATCVNKHGLDGYLTTSFALVGASGAGYAQVSTTCPGPGRRPAYEATVINSLGNSVSEPVSPGDRLTYAANVSSTGESYTLTDSNAGPLTLAGPGFSVTEVEALQEAQAGPFPEFDKVKFGPISFDGGTWAQLNPTGFNQVDGSVVQLKVSPLARSGAFHVTYVSQG